MIAAVPYLMPCKAAFFFAAATQELPKRYMGPMQMARWSRLKRMRDIKFLQSATSFHPRTDPIIAALTMNGLIMDAVQRR